MVAFPLRGFGVCNIYASSAGEAVVIARHDHGCIPLAGIWCLQCEWISWILSPLYFVAFPLRGFGVCNPKDRSKSRSGQKPTSCIPLAGIWCLQLKDEDLGSLDEYDFVAFPLRGFGVCNFA